MSRDDRLRKYLIRHIDAMLDTHAGKPYLDRLEDVAVEWSVAQRSGIAKSELPSTDLPLPATPPAPATSLAAGQISNSTEAKKDKEVRSGIIHRPKLTDDQVVALEKHFKESGKDIDAMAEAELIEMAVEAAQELGIATLEQMFPGGKHTEPSGGCGNSNDTRLSLSDIAGPSSGSKRPASDQDSARSASLTRSPTLHQGWQQQQGAAILFLRH